VSDVEQVKAAVGEDDALAGVSPVLDTAAEFIAGKDFGVVAQCDALSMARSSSSLLTAAVPRFMTTMPPAKLARRAASRDRPRQRARR